MITPSSRGMKKKFSGHKETSLDTYISHVLAENGTYRFYAKFCDNCFHHISVPFSQKNHQCSPMVLEIPHVHRMDAAAQPHTIPFLHITIFATHYGEYGGVVKSIMAVAVTVIIIVWSPLELSYSLRNSAGTVLLLGDHDFHCIHFQNGYMECQE